MKRASYRYGVQRIASNDDPGVLDEADVARNITVHLLADLFDVSSKKVATDVVRFRYGIIEQEDRMINEDEDGSPLDADNDPDA